ncbi:demethoxyubiquinone hydroxylase family protein [Halothermothrix orenii]|uniref:demethoxyubiquinone hydroxylase family protein n=1 Tax=Halothermothrix orenii TaxID=31909 RepID=UPI00030C9701|nr:ferritin-like domain-containing protein [Halothermothrix orenii]
MEDSKLLKWLNWFYTLELAQTDLYLNQAKGSKDRYMARVLIKLGEIEKTHALRFSDIIVKLGGKPTRIGALFSYLSGYIPGRLTPYIGTVNLFYVNYMMETIAIRDYKGLIKKINPKRKYRKELLDILVENLIDEDLHRSWFKDRRESLLNLKK